MQKFVDDTISKEYYEDFLSLADKTIESLKLFWFIIDQWDTSIDNVLFNKEGKPIAIDNANIANIQKVNCYGKPHFVRLFCTNKCDSGSNEEPIVIKGTGSSVLSALNNDFGMELPSFFKNALTELSSQSTSFTYLIENHRVWRNFNDDKKPQYYMQNFSKKALEKFRDIDYKNIFEKVIYNCLKYVSQNHLNELSMDKAALTINLTNHFNLISEGINLRYKIAEDYLISQLSATFHSPDFLNNIDFKADLTGLNDNITSVRNKG